MGSFRFASAQGKIISPLHLGEGVLHALKNGKNNLAHGDVFTVRMVLFSFAASFSVLACTQALQWFVYADWLHQTGPLHMLGGAVAGLVTFLFILRWQVGVRQRQAEMLRRFQTIAEMNDRIRNALQVIACTTYVANPETTERVRQAVGIIDGALQGVVADVAPAVANDQNKKRATTSKAG